MMFILLNNEFSCMLGFSPSLIRYMLGNKAEKAVLIAKFVIDRKSFNFVAGETLGAYQHS